MVEALFSLDLLFAGLLYLLGIVAHEWVSVRGGQWFAETPLNDWLFLHVGLPALRAALLTLFVLLAYPGLFGHQELPALNVLVFTGDGRVSLLVLSSLVLSLLLPLLPVIGNRRALVLPLQGMAIAALLFDWLCLHLGVVVESYLPGSLTLLAMLVLAVIAPRLASALAEPLGERLDLHYTLRDSSALLFDALLLALQIPVLLVYTLGLGERLG